MAAGAAELRADIIDAPAAFNPGVQKGAYINSDAPPTLGRVVGAVREPPLRGPVAFRI